MNWLQFELSLASGKVGEVGEVGKVAELEALENLLTEHGACAITYKSGTDEAVLEPNPGETPLWRVIRLLALFELSADFAALRLALAQRKVGWDVRFIGEKDWQNYARTFAVDHTFAQRLRIRPPLTPDEDGQTAGDQTAGDQTPGNIATLYLEPGLAFGSGSHPTTRLCLAWLAEHVHADQQVLDFGCGSGVLAIAAALLGANCHAVDHDSQAVLATNENARNNGVNADQLFTWDPDEWRIQRKLHQFDVVVANILAEPLKTLAGQFQEIMKKDASIVLSGILSEQADDVMQAYERIDFAPPQEQEGWVCLSGVLRD